MTDAGHAAVPPAEVRREIYTRMFRSRRFEEALGTLFAEGKLGGWFHSCVGHEATGSVASLFLRPEDHLIPYHRSRSSILGKGMPARALAAEILGRATSPTLGRGGEIHVHYPALKIYGTTGVLGASLPIAAGAAYSAQLRKADEVAYCAFGDGTSNRGAVHEALNLAAIWDLPVVYVCENNLYSEFSPIADQLRITDIADRAAGYGIPGVVVDGNDPDALHPVLEAAFVRARSGAGPTLIEAKTYRLNGHYEGDPQAYRERAEVATWASTDPVVGYRRRLLEEAVVTTTELDGLEAGIEAEITEAVEAAYADPVAGPEQVHGSVFADGGAA